ncbi:MAG: DUF1045 domain-containing protein [Pseudomonadota bacterium]
MTYSRFAIYYIPSGPLADFGAAWLGWDVRTAALADQPEVPGVSDVVAAPRKYGFHGTLKPPFRLSHGTTRQGLEMAVGAMASELPPAQFDQLALSQLGRFLALTPHGDLKLLEHIAGTCVMQLDAFRAPAFEAELARRRRVGLTSQQEALLLRWGYPYVLDEFRFHLTLTGRLDAAHGSYWKSVAQAHMPKLPEPFSIDQISLVGERPDGYFELIRSYALTG